MVARTMHILVAVPVSDRVVVERARFENSTTKTYFTTCLRTKEGFKKPLVIVASSYCQLALNSRHIMA